MSLIHSIWHKLTARPSTPAPVKQPSSKAETTVQAEEDASTYYDALTRDLDLPTFEGKVKYAYDRAETETPEVCPKCKAGTQQQYADFIFTTPNGPQETFVPAGYFCTACPSVIVDQDMIRAEVEPELLYQTAIGIGFDAQSRRPHLFRRWNGDETLFIIDKDDRIMGFETQKSSDKSSAQQKSRPGPNKRKIAKASRKKNRRKK